MDNQNGGQNSDWNYWRRLANSKGENIPGAPKPSDPAATGDMTSAQQRQQTATEIARKKLLETYKMQPQDYKSPSEVSPTPTANSVDWRKYHSAWQDYYQKYYGEYYGKAAREYVARERMKFEREQAEKERKEVENNGGVITSYVDTAESKEVQDDFRARIREKAQRRAKKGRKSRHLIPLVIGGVVILVGVFFQYNQVIIANVVAYMSPSSTTSGAITEIDPTLVVNVHDKPTLMIPKLNVEVPVTFGSKTDVDSMNIAMGNGVANFSIKGASAKPGEIGNFVISGHSAGNIYQKSDYKFIFSGLTRMTNGDMIYMDYNGARYAYKVTGIQTVKPSNVQALRDIATNNAGKPMITLITCTPLGTSKYRLLVYGEQVYPSYENAPTPAPTTGSDDGDEEMPSNQKPPLESFWDWLTGQN